MLEGVKSRIMFCLLGIWENGFNPWYVGGGVKSHPGNRDKREGKAVSILGMLEGVLKVLTENTFHLRAKSFNPWYVGGGVKSLPGQVAGVSGSKFQSLVCWRGC